MSCFLFGKNDFVPPSFFAGLAVEADEAADRSAFVRAGHKDVVLPNDWRGVPWRGKRRFPADVIGRTKLDRQVGFR